MSTKQPQRGKLYVIHGGKPRERDSKAENAACDLRLRRLRRALEAARHRHGQALGPTGATRTMVDARVVTQRWSRLLGSAGRALALSDEHIRSGRRAPFVVNSLFDDWSGARIVPGAHVVAEYSGDPHGGRTELRCERDGRTADYLAALRFTSTTEGLLDGFFATYLLPTLGHFWHGHYGRDYQLLITLPQVLQILARHYPLEANDARLEPVLHRPGGVRITRAGCSVRVSCLGAERNGSIVDLTVQFFGGRVHREPRELLLESSTLCFY